MLLEGKSVIPSPEVHIKVVAGKRLIAGLRSQPCWQLYHKPLGFSYLCVVNLSFKTIKSAKEN